MKNWQEYVGYQPINHFDNNDKPIIFSVKNIISGNRLFFSLEKIFVEEFPFSYDDVGDIVEEYIKNFPKFCIDKNISSFINIEKAKLESCRKTKRGFPNKIYKVEKGLYIFYKGSYAYDASIFVTEYNSKYAVIKHPNFEDYGYFIEKSESIL